MDTFDAISAAYFWLCISNKMVTPLVKHNIIKKRTAKFVRHQAEQFFRIRRHVTWRKPKGIDNPVRRRFKGMAPMPVIGYGTAKKYKHVMPNGFLKFRVSNVKEIELLLMHNRKYAAEIASNVSIRKRRAIVERAAQLNIKLTNGNAKLRTEESE